MIGFPPVLDFRKRLLVMTACALMHYYRLNLRRKNRCPIYRNCQFAADGYNREIDARMGAE